MSNIRSRAEAAAALDAAKVVLLPGGRDMRACAENLRAVFDLDVPEFPDGGRRLSIVGGGKKFVKVKGKDVPPLVNLLDDCVGAAGTDTWIEYGSAEARLSACEIGAAMCSFAVLVPEQDVESVRERMRRAGSPAVVAATSYPQMLRVCAAANGLNIVPADFRPSGSVESMVELEVAGVVADLAESYETARQNGLAEAANLLPIKPMLIWRGA